MPTTNLAILVSDLHFSNSAPVARAGEPNWFEAMRDPLWWLTDLQRQLDGIPIIAAGDIWDRWSQPPGVVNFIIDHCPTMYSIPGQHDLAAHDYANRETSAYGTLVRAGTLIELIPGEKRTLGPRFYVEAFPWGFDLDATVQPKPGATVLAVCHRYVHNGQGTKYIYATEEQGVAHVPGLVGYSAAHFGDNHIPFVGVRGDGMLVINTGGFYRRAADQIGHRPGVVSLSRNDETGKLFATRHDYPTEGEQLTRDHIVAPSHATAHTGVDDFILGLSVESQEATNDFRSYVRRFADQDHVSPMVCDLLKKAVE